MINCRYKNDLYYSYEQINQELNIGNLNKAEFLYFKCVKILKNMKFNIALLLYLILIIFMIICLSLYMKKNETYDKKAFRNDIIENNIDKLVSSLCLNEKDLTEPKKFEKNDTEKRIETYNEKTNDNDPENNNNDDNDDNDDNDNNNENKNDNNIENNNYNTIDNDFTFCMILKKNFIQLYPIIYLWHPSFLNPFDINLFQFVFNVSNLFGLNAILYFEKIIEKRIFNENRKNIFYPFSDEFSKLIYSILSAILLNLIIKGLILITIEQSNAYQVKINIEGNNSRYKNFKDFEKKIGIRRLISKIIMFLLIILFGYFSILFCSIYYKTQWNWFLSGIFCLLIEWIILAPLYIILISVFQKNGFIEIVYYLRRFFLF